MKLITMIFLFIVFSIMPAHASDFIDGLEDVPVMNGLKQIPHDAISFGNEASRFVEATLEGENISFKNVERFYLETLPQLGWHFQNKNKGMLSFYRDRETLDISSIQTKPLHVRITVKSKN